MKLKKGDVFKVVNDGQFHIDVQTDLVGQIMEVIEVEEDQPLKHPLGFPTHATVKDVETLHVYTLSNENFPEDDFEDHYALQPPEPTTTGAVKSDGGSSSYYDLELPEWLVDRIVERNVSEGKFYVKTEELIEAVFNNDFDFGTVFKSLVRAQGAFYGAGKAGNTLPYECNKVRYYTNRIEQRNGQKEG